MNKRDYASFFICLSALLILLIPRYLYSNSVPLQTPIIFGEIASFSIIIWFVFLYLVKNLKLIKDRCYDKVRESIIENILDKTWKSNPITGRAKFVILSILINFFAVSILASFLSNPTSNTSNIDIPIIGDIVLHLLGDQNINLISITSQNIVYFYLFSSIGPSVLILLRRIREKQKNQYSDDVPGIRLLIVFLYTSPFVLLLNGLPPNDPYVYGFTLLASAILTIATATIAFALFITEIIFSKFWKMD